MSAQVRNIKKYPNRRLYDTETSSYITLADVKKLVLENVEFKVEDAKSKEDLTRSILLQIILEEESAGSPMFTSDSLSQIIRFYGNAMQGMMGGYLEKNIQTFMQIQQKLQDQSRQVYGQNPMLNSETWNEFVKMQGPAMQGLMGRYLEQSARHLPRYAEPADGADAQSVGQFPLPRLPGRGRSQERRRRTEVVTGRRPNPSAIPPCQFPRAKSASFRSAARRRSSIPNTS